MKKIIGFLACAVAVISATCFAFATSTPIYGDADNNGTVTVSDAATVLDKVLTNKSMPIEENDNYKKYIDLNSNNIIDSEDVAIILQMALDSNYKPEISTEATTDGTTEVTTDKTTESTTIDTSDGIVVDNFTDLKKAVAQTGKTIYVKGNIDCPERLNLNTKNANIQIIGITNDDGTAATLDFASLRDSLKSKGESGVGVYIKGTHYTLKNLIVQNAGDCGLRIKGNGTGYSTIENCVFRYNNNSGISVTNGASNNTFKSVDCYRNADIVQSLGSDADGFSVKLSAGENNYFYNCRAYENSDDGWDSYDKITPYVGRIDYIECLTWNNGNNKIFTGEYDYENGNPLDKNLLYVQAILKSDPDFETKYNNHQVTSWPQVDINILGLSASYSDIHNKWSGNPNGFKFGSINTPDTSYRNIKNCIAFDHTNKGFDQNNAAASYDIENALSFNNGRNYYMSKMTSKSAKGVLYSFGNTSSSDSVDSNVTLTTPDKSKQTELKNTVYAYRDMIRAYVDNNKIPGEQICNVF